MRSIHSAFSFAYIAVCRSLLVTS